MTNPGDLVHDLIEAVRAVRAVVAEASYPLPLPSAEPARAARAAVLGQVDDYLLPRLGWLDAPLLVVVGGSTGAGKSTLVNSLVQAPVSPAGVLRPTTRTPVLACHPADTGWFRAGGRLAVAAPVPPIAAPALPPGLALLDVPDVTTTTGSRPDQARQLLSAADLWLFVTTGARYADAVPWELLREARERGTVVALVLGRVPEAVPSGSTVSLVAHLTELLAQAELAGVPLFVVPETRVDGQGLLPEPVISPLRSWVSRLAADAHARGTVARCTLDGALAALPARLATLAAAADDQSATAESLAEAVGIAYGGARAVLERALTGTDREGGSPGPAMLPPRLPPRRRASAADRERWVAWQAGLVTLVTSAAADAAELAGTAWQRYVPMPDPAHLPDGSSPGLAGKVQRLARSWDGTAVADLLDRLGELLDVEAARWLDGLATVPPGGSLGRRLRAAATVLDRGRIAADLGAELVPPVPPETAPPPVPPESAAPEPAAPEPAGHGGADQPGEPAPLGRAGR